MKPWVIAAALFVLLAGGALLWAGTERPSDEGRVRGGLRGSPASRPPATTERDRWAPPVSVGQRPAASAEPVEALRAEVVASAAAGRLPAEGAVDWEAIPLDRAMGESLGDITTRQAFSAAMRQPSLLPPCTDGWEAPPGIRRLDMDLELRVRSVDDALIVEDARIIDANVSDASVERCVIEALRGRRAPAPGIRPGQAYRLRWGASKTLR